MTPTNNFATKFAKVITNTLIRVLAMGKKQNNSRTEDRTQNLLGASSMDPHHCEREIITIRPCDFIWTRSEKLDTILIYKQLLYCKIQRLNFVLQLLLGRRPGSSTGKNNQVEIQISEIKKSCNSIS